jgi:hypothetical protein
LGQEAEPSAASISTVDPGDADSDAAGGG